MNRCRFNFKKVKWKAFSTDLDTLICDIDPYPENYDRFVKVVHAITREHIPRGCRKNQVPGLTPDLAEQYSEYTQLYEQDRFATATITTGDEQWNSGKRDKHLLRILIQRTTAKSMVAEQEAEQRSTQSRQTCQRITKSICTSTHTKWQGSK